MREHSHEPVHHVHHHDHSEERVITRRVVDDSHAHVHSGHEVVHHGVSHGARKTITYGGQHVTHHGGHYDTAGHTVVRKSVAHTSGAGGIVRVSGQGGPAARTTTTQVTKQASAPVTTSHTVTRTVKGETNFDDSL